MSDVSRRELFANSAVTAVAEWTAFFFGNEATSQQDSATRLRRVMVAPYGDWPNARGMQRFTQDDAFNIVNDFNGITNKALHLMGLPWYEGHPDHPDFRGKPGHKRPTAVGRIKSLEAAADGLYANVKFNNTGEDLIENACYHGHSVNWFLKPSGDGTSYRPFKLKSIGFTNEPNIPVPAVTTANEMIEAMSRYLKMSVMRLFGNAWSDEARAAALLARKRASHLSSVAKTHKEHMAARDAHSAAAKATAKAGMAKESDEHDKAMTEHDTKAFQARNDRDAYTGENQTAMGMIAEKEHGKSDDETRKIVADHLKEDPQYYSKLKSAKLAPELEAKNCDDKEMKNCDTRRKKMAEMRNSKVKAD